MSNALGEYHSDYEPEMWVVAAWNGSGTAMVFSSRDAFEKMMTDYEDFRVAYSLPWLHGKEAVNGDHVLLMYELGLRPWKVALGPEGGVLSVSALPLHHIKLELVLARYKSGTPRLLEVWAESQEYAAFYTYDMLMWQGQELPDISQDVQFNMEDHNATAEHTAQHETEAPVPAPRTAPVVIPGFGSVVDLGSL